MYKIRVILDNDNDEDNSKILKYQKILTKFHGYIKKEFNLQEVK